MVLVQFSNTFELDYALDDTIVVLQNPRVNKGLVDIGSYFKKSKSEFLEDQYGYRPITLISLALDVEFLGEGAFGGHLMNVIYFALLCMVLFFTLQLLFPDVRKLFPFLVVLLFLVHPLHVEAVANIKSRDELLAMLFGILALNLHLQWFDKGKIHFLVLSVLSIGLGLLSKESALTFLAVMPLALLIQSGRSLKERLLKAAIFPAIGILIALGVAYMGSSNTTDNMALTEGTGIFMEHKLMGNAIFQQHQFHERFATGTGIMLRYIKNFLVPYPLVYYSGFNQIPLTGFGDPLVWASLLFHLTLLYLAIRYFRKEPILAFGILFYFLTISPYTHILRPLSDAMADRFMLSPSLGLAILVVFGLMKLAKVSFFKTESRSQTKINKKGKPKNQIKPNPKATAFGLGIVILLLGFGGLTRQRNKAWKDNLTLFSTDIPNLEQCARCHFQYAEVLTSIQKNSTNSVQVQKDIIHHFRRAIEITKESYNSYISLGRAYYVFGMFAQGDSLLTEATLQYPDQSRPFFHLGYGKFVQKKYGEAIVPLQKACDLAPNREETYFYLAWSHYNNQNEIEGIQVMESAKKKYPKVLTYYDALSDMYIGISQLDIGFDYMKQALQIEPNNPGIYQKLINRYLQYGDSTQAQKYQNEAIQKGLMR